MPDTNRPFERAMALAALSGLKIALGPAFLLSARDRPGSRNWVAGAMGEMVLEDMALMDRGLPPQVCKRAERETVARLRSKPVVVN